MSIAKMLFAVSPFFLMESSGRPWVERDGGGGAASARRRRGDGTATGFDIGDDHAAFTETAHSQCHQQVRRATGDRGRPRPSVSRRMMTSSPEARQGLLLEPVLAAPGVSVPIFRSLVLAPLRSFPGVWAATRDLIGFAEFEGTMGYWPCSGTL